MQAGMIGLGNFGCAVGNLIANNGYQVLGWDHNPVVVDEINKEHTNSHYLSDINLHPNLVATSDLEQVFQSSEVIFVAIPSRYIVTTLSPFREITLDNAIVVNLAKGIDGETGLTAFQTISKLFPQMRKVALSGPSIANEFARCMPTTVVIAGMNDEDLLAVSLLLDNDFFRTRFSRDVIGVELGGILKNIYAIGLGLFDGKSITSINFRSVYLTISLEEIAKIGMGMGAHLDTFLYVSGMGDLLATSMSEHSHNRQLGEYLAQDLSLEEIEQRMGMIPEGYNTLSNVLYIAEKLHISMPLAKGLWDVINGRYSAEKFIYSFIKDFVE